MECKTQRYSKKQKKQPGNTSIKNKKPLSSFKRKPCNAKRKVHTISSACTMSATGKGSKEATTSETPLDQTYKVGSQTLKFLSTFLPDDSIQQATLPTALKLVATSTSIPIGNKNASKSHHKGQNGRLLLFGGSACFSGAAFFATKAATLIGGELSQILTEPTAVHSLRSLNPDIMCSGIIPSLNSYSDFTSGLPAETDLQMKNDSTDYSMFQHAILRPKLQLFCPPPTNRPLLPTSVHEAMHPSFSHEPYYLRLVLSQSYKSALATTKIIPHHRTQKSEPPLESQEKLLYNLLWWLFLEPAPNAPKWNESPISHVAGPGLGQDLITMTFMSTILSTSLLTSRSIFVLDADSLALFKSKEFTTTVMIRGLNPLENPNGNNSRDPKNHDRTQLDAFHNTVLTPNKNELGVLYQTLVSNALTDLESRADLTKYYQAQEKIRPSYDQCQPLDYEAWTTRSEDETLTVIPLPADNHPNSPIWKPSNEDFITSIQNQIKSLSSDSSKDWARCGARCGDDTLRSTNSFGDYRQIPYSQLFTTSTYANRLFHLIDHASVWSQQNAQIDSPLSTSDANPPQIIQDEADINKAIAISRFLNGTTVYLKGERDVITDGSTLAIVALNETSPSRCGGQGDITTGLIAGFSPHVGRWWSNASAKPITSNPSIDLATALLKTGIVSPTIISSILASYTLKLAAAQTFKEKYTSTNAAAILDSIPGLTKAVQKSSKEA